MSLEHLFVKWYKGFVCLFWYWQIWELADPSSVKPCLKKKKKKIMYDYSVPLRMKRPACMTTELKDQHAWQLNWKTSMHDNWTERPAFMTTELKDQYARELNWKTIIHDDWIERPACMTAELKDQHAWQLNWKTSMHDDWTERSAHMTLCTLRPDRDPHV